jgi:hypothetical protein
MKVFLSYQFKDDISDITGLLKESGVEVFDSMSDMEYGSSLQDSVNSAIAECDFVFLVYSSSNPHLAFEAGMAVSQRKPIFAVISERKEDPAFLFDSTYVHALPTEKEKIKFNLTIFLDKIKRKQNLNLKKDIKFYGGGFPNFYPEIMEKYNDLNRENGESLEMFFKYIFQLYGLNVIQKDLNSRVKFTTDFCIWSDNLTNILGNPILIEIKKEINKSNLKLLNDTLQGGFSNYPAESCIVFYDRLQGLDKRMLPNSSKCLYIQISDFIEKLDNRDFNAAVKQVRNEIVHQKH